MQNQGQVVKKESASLIKSEIKVWTLAEQARLAEALGLLFDGQKQFGKSSGQLENMTKLFCWVMKHYPLEKVMAGLAEYVKYHADIPTSSDIVKIIDPPPEPWKPDWSVYSRFKKLREDEGQYALNDEEMAYMIRCEEFSLRHGKQ